MDLVEYKDLFQKELQKRAGMSLKGDQTIIIRKSFKDKKSIDTAVSELIEHYGLIEKK